MTVALVEPFAGIAGDMLLGALLDAGARFPRVKGGLGALDLADYRISHRRVSRCGLAARKVTVTHGEGHHHRGLTTILRLLKKAQLPRRVHERAAAAFTRLGEAEARVHGVSVDEVHFHEVGAVDAICDIVGAALALEDLGVARLYCRPLPLSTGSVAAAHGRLPLPAPATMELLKGRPAYDSGLEGELVTPTGAAMIAAWCEDGAPPALVPRAIGYGAGTRDPEGYPNVCRVVVADAAPETSAGLWELVCDVDDATPQVLGHLLGRLLEAGALDATLHPEVMKKDRPGVRVTALARTQAIPAVEEAMFTEGTTLGVRRRAVERTELPRRVVAVTTPYGRIRVKVGELRGKAVHVAPEFEDCRAAAQEHGVPLREVVRAAVAQWSA